MKAYTEPMIKIFEFDVEEILTTSGPTPTPGLNDNEEGNMNTGGSIVIPNSVHN